VSFTPPSIHDLAQVTSLLPYTAAGARAVTAGREVFEFIGGDLVDDSIQELVTMSLFTWRLARDGDPVPPEGRQGWFADAEMGSRLYLLQRAKLSPETLADAKAYAEEALAWLVEEGIVSKVRAVASFIGKGRRGLELAIGLTPPTGAEAVIRYAYLLES
jgi:phage gp46-like protein